ncbi:ribonuclease R [Thiolapillus sp.]
MAKSRKKKKSHNRDPYRAREERKYQNPIPSREYILETMEAHGVPVKSEDLASLLGLKDPKQIEALSYRVKAMLRDGQIVRNRRGGLCVVNKKDLIAGRIIAHPDGFGFLRPDEGGEDLFMSPREMRPLWHDDRVVVQVTGMDRRGRREGSVVEILERAHSQIVGRIHVETGVGFLVPDNKRMTHRVIIPDEHFNGVEEGQMVVVEILEQPTKWRQPIGRVAEVIGDHMAPGMETDVAIRAHDIPVIWPEEVEQEIASLKEEVPESAKEGRVDLRELPLVTIDGADARDFDDAVYCQRTPKGWKLLVCIADVSSYVPIGSALDGEAYKRGNSTYFPDRVIPMLPEVLSNGLCSLNPNVDRLCMTAELYISREGKIQRSRFLQAVMRSHARLTYNEVAAMLFDGDKTLRDKHEKLLPHLEELNNLYHALHEARKERGAIDFDTVETRFVFDDNGRLSGIVPTVRNDAHRIIEECMLVANVASARLLLRKKIPALYRVHEPPSEDKLNDLHQFLAQLGLKLNGGDKPTAKDYAELIEQIKDRPDAHMIQTVLLRSMMQAIYSSENIGHFGLAFPAYTHFTSPIRRYPDLLVHRAIRHLLVDGRADTFEYSFPQMATMGEHCSMTERRSDEATRDSADALKCEFMLDKVGQEYEGLIVSVNSFGVFVELKDVYITGLVHITSLDHDFFHFDPIAHKLVGERSGKTYRLGDSIRVVVAAVNMDDRKIDLALANRGEKPAEEKKRSRKRRPRRRKRK